MIKKQLILSIALLCTMTPLALANPFANESYQGSKDGGQEKSTATTNEGEGFTGKVNKFISYLASLAPIQLSKEEENLIEDCYLRGDYYGKFYDPKNNAVADYPNGQFYKNDWSIVKIEKDQFGVFESFGVPGKEREEEIFNIYTIFREPKTIGYEECFENLDITCSTSFVVDEKENPTCLRLYGYLSDFDKRDFENSDDFPHSPIKQKIFPVEIVITNDQGNKVARYRAVANVQDGDKNSLVILSSSFTIPLSGRCSQLHEEAFKQLIKIANVIGCNDIAHRASRMEVDYYHTTWFKQLQHRGLISKDMAYHT